MAEEIVLHVYGQIIRDYRNLGLLVPVALETMILAELRKVRGMK